MPVFGDASKARLDTCHRDLVVVMNHAIVKGPDFTILCGHRSVQEQARLFAQGRTEPGPKVTNADGVNDLSPHNYPISHAVDIAPYPIDWNNTSRFMILGGYVLGIAQGLGIDLRWGGDFNRNYDNSDEIFSDLPHFELGKSYGL
jgi:peptidoglycan LD-endopeptidase CwlK